MGVTSIVFGVPVVFIKFTFEQEAGYTLLGPTTGGVNLTTEMRRNSPICLRFTCRSLTKHPKAMLGELYDIKLLHPVDNQGTQAAEELIHMELIEIIHSQPASDLETYNYVFRERQIVAKVDNMLDFQVKG